MKNTSRKESAPSDQVIKNEGIRFPEVRVVFEDEITGKSTWKVLSKADALKLAKSRKLDLILGMCL